VTTPTDLQSFLSSAQGDVSRVLEVWGSRARDEFGAPVGEAVAYSLEGPGKRFRPALVMAVYRELGGQGDVAEFASAVEVVHTYSLVHDDLPCMDNDDLRRGRPTTHRAFDVATATEAGYRMVPMAARVLAAGARRLDLDQERLSRAGHELFDAAGARGMVGGQLLDLEAEGQNVSLDQLREIHRRKTGALITASVVLGAIAANSAPPVEEAVRGYGQEIGLAFQIADDVLDATGTSQELGKTAGKDARQNKATFATLMGTDTAMEEARDRVDTAIALLGRAGIDSKLLNELAFLIINRRS
jgi:geranylgeranyl pyrophosphate synthase